MTFEQATRKANLVTKLFGEYYTAVPSDSYPGMWLVSKRYHSKNKG